MSARLRAIAQDTERIVAAGAYLAPDGAKVSIGPAVARAVAGTCLYGPDPAEFPGLPAVEAPGSGEAPQAAMVFEVTAESSLQAARRLTGASADRVAVLDFASARNPGGGYLNGAQAQEEAVCRGSALYRCLRAVPDFYAAHRADRSPLYSDRVVHSPGVPVFRDDSGELLREPYHVGFLACAAPNAGETVRQRPDLAGRIPQVLAGRAERVLQVAAAHGYRRLVLGAWGCGVFRNDPAQVAAAFAGQLTGGGPFANRFTKVVFAVLDRRAAPRCVPPSPRASCRRGCGAGGSGRALVPRHPPDAGDEQAERRQAHAERYQGRVKQRQPERGEQSRADRRSGVVVGFPAMASAVTAAPAAGARRQEPLRERAGTRG